MQLKFVFFLASTIVTALGTSSVTRCFDELQDIQEKVKALNSGIENFDHTNLLEAWDLHLRARKVQVAIEQVATCAEVVTVNVSEAETSRAVSLVRTIVNMTLEGLVSLQGLKPEIEKIKIPGSKVVIKRDLEDLRVGSSLLQILAERTPANLSTEAAQHKASVDQAFEQTIKLFS